MNRGMERLGWDEFELDDHTLQLITSVFETDGEYKKARDYWYDFVVENQQCDSNPHN